MPAIDDQLFKWIANNGFAVVIALVLLVMLNLIIKDAITYFTRRLDLIQSENAARYMNHDTKIDSMNETLAGINSSVQSLTVFISQNMMQIVAHRQAIEGPDAQRNVPSEVMIKKEGTNDN